jgi:hypothetical protein
VVGPASFSLLPARTPTNKPQPLMASSHRLPSTYQWRFLIQTHRPLHTSAKSRRPGPVTSPLSPRRNAAGLPSNLRVRLHVVISRCVSDHSMTLCSGVEERHSVAPPELPQPYFSRKSYTAVHVATQIRAFLPSVLDETE